MTALDPEITVHFAADYAISKYAPLAHSSHNTKPNARWRAGFSLVPSIPAGCAGKRKVNALVQGGKIDIAKEPATFLPESGPQ